MIRRIAKAINGEVCEYRWHALEERAGGDGRVAVKKVPNKTIESTRGVTTDERSAYLKARGAPIPEDALTEIGVFSFLSEREDLPLYILRMLGLFADRSETWIVTDLAQGGDLFCVAASGSAIAEPQLRRFTWQLLQAVAYLHAHGIGHRDVSLQNMLLDRPCGEEGASIRLTDFGMAVRCRSASGTPLRYFRPVGKAFYRSPECNMPTATAEVGVFAPVGSRPRDVVLAATNNVLCEVRLPADAQPGQLCMAELWGYEAAPADVFACAICLFILAWQSPLWHRAVLTDPSFAFFRGRGGGVAGVGTLLRSWKRAPRPAGALELVSEILALDPKQRPSAETCLANAWFADLNAAVSASLAGLAAAPALAPTGIASVVASAAAGGQ